MTKFQKKAPEPTDVFLNESVTEQLILKRMSEDLDFAHMVLGSANCDIFTAKPLGKIYTIFKTFYTKHPENLLTLNMIRQSTMNTDGLLNPFLDEMNKINTAEYCDAMILINADKFIREQKFSMATRHAVDIFTNPEKKTPENIAMVMDMMSNAQASALFYDMGLDYFNSIEERYTREREKHKFVVPTGIKIWDAQLTQTNNGLPPGTLSVIAGQSNIGKSIILGNIAVNACMFGKKVVWVTCEMDEDTCALRVDAGLSQININDLMKHQQSVMDALNEWKRNHKECSLRIKEFPTSLLTPAQLKNYLIQLRNKFKFDIVIIDYINIMSSDRASSGDNSYTKIKQIAEDLRAMSTFFHVPFVTATQLNRSGYAVDSKPTPQSIGESMALFATADVVIVLYQKQQDIIANIIRSGFLKNRIGAKDKEFMHPMDYVHMTMKDGTEVQQSAEENVMSKFFGISNMAKEKHE